MGRFSKNMNKKFKNVQKSAVTPKFKKLVKDFMDEHEDVLRKLAKR